MATIPEHYRDLLDKPIVVSLATIQPDGRPQVTPVWADYDGTYIRINTAEGRQKHRNMTAHQEVTVMAMDPQNPYRYIEVRGRVARITPEGADDHIDKLAREYTGAPEYQNRVDGEKRVICYVEPERVSAQG